MVPNDLFIVLLVFKYVSDVRVGVIRNAFMSYNYNDLRFAVAASEERRLLSHALR